MGPDRLPHLRQPRYARVVPSPPDDANSFGQHLEKCRAFELCSETAYPQACKWFLCLSLLQLTAQISTIPSQSHPTGYIVSNADDLLHVFDADAGLLVIGSGCKLLGTSDQGQAMLAIAEYLRIVKFE